MLAGFLTQRHDYKAETKPWIAEWSRRRFVSNQFHFVVNTTAKSGHYHGQRRIYKPTPSFTINQSRSAGEESDLTICYARIEQIFWNHHPNAYGSWCATSHAAFSRLLWRRGRGLFCQSSRVDQRRTVAPQQRMVEAWAELHQDALLEDWRRLQAGQLPQPIAPLQ